jgi:hypothetical protein
VTFDGGDNEMNGVGECDEKHQCASAEGYDERVVSLTFMEGLRQGVGQEARGLKASELQKKGPITAEAVHGCFFQEQYGSQRNQGPEKERNPSTTRKIFHETAKS